jgi:hypothetical protein
MSARRAALALLVLALPACGDPGEHAVPQGGEPVAEPAWAPVVRRPPWRFVFERTGERCRVRRIDGGERVVDGEDAACPAYLQVGDRIRLAGAVCLHETGATRTGRPVVCPDALTNAEKAFLREQELLPEE